jgi:uncharacterized membrane protein
LESRAKILGHPIHQMLIPLPLGLLAMGLVFDVIHLISDQEQLARAAYYMIAAGILTGLLAAVFGLIDWLAIPRDTRAWQIGLYHMIANVTVLALFTGHGPGPARIFGWWSGGCLWLAWW